MSIRSERKKGSGEGDATHARKDFNEVAERIFRDDSPAEPLYGSILADTPTDDAA